MSSFDIRALQLKYHPCSFSTIFHGAEIWHAECIKEILTRRGQYTEPSTSVLVNDKISILIEKNAGFPMGENKKAKSSAIVDDVTLFSRESEQKRSFSAAD